MIQIFKKKWNNSCDSIANFLVRQNDYFTQKNEKTKYIFDKINYVLITTIPKTYKFISMCNYYQTPTINIFKKEIQFTYKRRRFLVYSLSFTASAINQKGFIRSYIGLSSLFCRENLNPRNYKFNLLPEDKNKRNNELNEIKSKV